MVAQVKFAIIVKNNWFGTTMNAAARWRGPTLFPLPVLDPSVSANRYQTDAV